jgi:hypothetical protein
MLKRLVPLVAAALLLAALVPAPPAQADRLYSYCDPFKSVFCQGLVSLYSFEEGTNSARTSETGSSLFLEPDGVNIAPVSTPTAKMGTYSFPHTAAANSWLRIRNTVGIGGDSWTLALWIYIDTLPSADGKRVQVLSVKKPNGAEGYPRLEIIRTGASSFFRWTEQGVSGPTGPTVTTTGTDALATGKWIFLTIGAYSDPTTTYPYQHTVWMETRCLTTCSATRTTSSGSLPSKADLGDLYIGAWDATSPNEYGAYKVDGFGAWTWPFSTADATALYNSGNFKTFPFVD